MTFLFATEAPAITDSGGFFGETAGVMLVLPFLVFFAI